MGGNGSTASWNFPKDTASDSYFATVRVEDPPHGTAECSFQVIVKERDRSGPESGWSFLVRDQPEQKGYGLYSYLLFGSRPNATAQERYAQAVKAYSELMPAITDLERLLPRRELNVTYLPVDAAPGSTPSDPWALEHYDYARARVLLRTLAGDHRDGPYVISALKPIPANAPIEGPYLFQDLSRVPPQLVSSWVKEFLNQAAQERPWEERTGRRLALRVRTILAVAAMGFDPVVKNLNALIAWIPKTY